MNLSQLIFTLLTKICLPVTINGNIIPYKTMLNTMEWLYTQGCDGKNMWKRKEQNWSWDRKIYWLLSCNSQQIFVYNQILKPVWTCGIQLWAYAIQCHINRIQTFKNKVLWNIVDTLHKEYSWCRITGVHHISRIIGIVTEIKRFTVKHEARLQQHILKIETIQLWTTVQQEYWKV